MEHVLILSAVALLLVAATNILAEKLPIPVPVVQTAVGIALAFIPGVPRIALDPDFVLLAVLPPLVYAAAVQLPWEEFRENLRAIATLAFGLVAATVAAAAAVAHSIVPGLSWPAALVLGAVVSPTDPVASTALASRIGVPRRLIAVLEGEGLVNDAVALTIKTIALAALLGAGASVSSGLVRFVVIVAGEIGYGLALGWFIAQVRKRIDDASTETVVTLVTPFAAYLVPWALGGSGVLATVATGMYIGEQSPELVPSGIRLRLTSVWQVIVYVLNGILFLLTGLQARSIWSGTGGQPGVLQNAAAIALTVIFLRFVWAWPAAKLPRWVLSIFGDVDPMPPVRHLGFVAWSGMRGAISLAAALSLPAELQFRREIIFMTAFVIAATLLVQGTTLPWLIRILRLDADAANEREAEQRSEASARSEIAACALEALRGETSLLAHRIRQDYELVEKGAGEVDSTYDAARDAELRSRALAAQRRRLIDLHRNGRISAWVLGRLERDLDLQEAALENRVSSEG